MKTNLIQLYRHKEILKEYLLVKLEQEDYHGVRDCCTDIEIINAKIELLKEQDESLVD
jgi:hypothetical protein